MFNLGNAERSKLSNIKIENNYNFNYNKEDFDMTSKLDSHAAIARNIEEKSVVLDVGCASGNFGKILKDFKNCTIDGIEYDVEALKFAEKHNCYRKLYNFSITDEEDLNCKEFFSSNKMYDYIVFGDVLEHLTEPYKTLKHISKLLKKGGSIIVSVPNIAYIDTILGLINGKFNYNDQGILDSTHLRFFTESSFVEMIENLAKTDALYFNLTLTDQIIVKPDYLNNYNCMELFNLNQNLDDFCTLQNIFVLTQVESIDKMKKYESKFNNTYLVQVEKRYNDLIKKENELQELNEKCSKLEKELREHEVELKNILGSKRWKLVNSIFKFLGK